MQEISDGLIATMVARSADGPLDLLDEYAFPLPITVISELIGVPDDGRDDFRTWTSTLLQAGPREQAQDAGMAMAQYLAGLIEAKRAEPTDDLLSELIRASDDGDRLTQGEVLGMVFLLLVAGHETTVNLIGNGMLALMRNPDQLAALRADRDLLPSRDRGIPALRRAAEPRNLPIHLGTDRIGWRADPQGRVRDDLVARREP